MGDPNIMSSPNISENYDNNDEDLDVDTIDVVTSEDTNPKQSRTNAACLTEKLNTSEHERPEESENASAENSYVADADKPKVQFRTDTESRGKHGTRLPMSRIKNMMKMDEDCTIISQDAVFLVTKATEMFIETITKETVKFLTSSKRKTLLKKDVDNVIDSIPHLCFLDGIFE